MRSARKLILLILAAALVLPALVTPAQASTPEWTIQGNSVVVDDDNVYLSASPHTIGSSGWVEFELVSKRYSGSVDIALGTLESENITMRRPQIWKDAVEHVVYRTETDDRAVATVTMYDITGYVQLDWGTYEGEPDFGNRNNSKLYRITGRPEAGMDPGAFDIAFNSYTGGSAQSTFSCYTTVTRSVPRYEYYPDWQPLAADFSRQRIVAYEADLWDTVTLDAPIQQDVSYRVRVWLEIPFRGTDPVSGKYAFAIKPSGETIAEAKENGHLYVLDPWYNQQWAYRRELRFDSSDYAAAVVNGIVLVEFDATNMDFSHCQSDGDDIRFTDHDETTLLAHREAVEWDAVGESAVFEVMVPQIDSGSLTDSIWVYYGNPTAASAENLADMFDSHTRMHNPHFSTDMSGDPFTSRDDYLNSIDVNGATWAEGIGRTFDGADDYHNLVNVIADVQNQNGTLLTWLKATGTTGDIISASNAGASHTSSIRFFLNADKLSGFCWYKGVNKWAVATTGTVGSSSGNVSLAMAHNGTTTTLYVNGTAPAQSFSVSADKTLWYADISDRFQAYYTGVMWDAGTSTYVYDYNGKIGETWIFDWALSATEVYHYYKSRRHFYGAGDSFIIYGAEEVIPIGVPVNFTATISGNNIVLTWTKGDYSDNTIIVRGDSRYPTSRTDGVLIYNGTGATTTDLGQASEAIERFYSAWTWHYVAGYTSDYATARTGGFGMIYIMLGALALGLTVAMFTTRNLLLGFPSAIFWAVFGGYAYTQSVVTWDWQYSLAFACLMGMIPFCVIAMFALRKSDLDAKKTDWLDSGKFIDEKPEVEKIDTSIGEASPRVREVRDRAERRRTKGIRRSPDYGEFK